jgi:hypothetical protein
MKQAAFGSKARAIALLRSEFMIPEGEIKPSLLDRCVAAEGNHYDVAVQYVIGRARSLPRTNERVERVLLQDIHFAEGLCAFCSMPSIMRERIVETRRLRMTI